MKGLVVVLLASLLVCDAMSPIGARAQLTNSPSASSRRTARVISTLLHKYPRGGQGMVVAIDHLVENDPASTPTLVAAASSMNPAQKAGVEEGIARAVAGLGKCDASGHCGSPAAQEIQDYLEANTSNPIVADILTDEVALGSIGNQDGGGNTGAGGGGFSGGAGQAISPS